jgi:hypothetical protein
MNNRTNPHWGSSLDDFLKEEGIFETTKAVAALRAVALHQALKRGEASGRADYSLQDLLDELDTERHLPG